MTVDSAYFIKQYLNDGEVTYRFDTESLGSEAIQVWTVAPDGERILLVEGSEYTLTFDESETPTYRNGTVTLSQPLPEGFKLSIERATPIINTLTLQGQERFPSEQFENMLDRICFIQQEIEGSFCDCRAVCVPVFITSQPVDQSAGTGTVTFTVVAGGTAPVTYQWQEDTAGDNNFSDMAGETNSTLTVADTSTNQYRVNVSNDCGLATSDVVSILPEPVVLEELTRGTGQFVGYHAGEGLVWVNYNTGRIVFNHIGYSSVQVSDENGENFKTRSVARSYNTGYPINHLSWSPQDDRWWVLVYRSQIREANFTYSENNFNYDEVGGESDSEWWGAGGNQGIAQSYSHAWWLGQQGIDGDAGTIHMCAVNDNGFFYYWPRPPFSISEPPVIVNGPEDPAGAFTYFYTPPINSSNWIHYSSDQMTKRIMQVWGDEGESNSFRYWTKRLIVPVEVDEFQNAFYSTYGGRICAFNGVDRARFLFDVVENDRVYFKEFYDDDTVAPPAPTTGFYQFDRDVENDFPVFGYGLGGWVCGALDRADRTKMCFVGDNITGTAVVDFPFPITDDIDKQLLYDVQGARWLFCTRLEDGSPVGAEKMYLFAINSQFIVGNNSW